MYLQCTTQTRTLFSITFISFVHTFGYDIIILKSAAMKCKKHTNSQLNYIRSQIKITVLDDPCRATGATQTIHTGKLDNIT